VKSHESELCPQFLLMVVVFKEAFCLLRGYQQAMFIKGANQE
jgi:hypothetical protein